MFNRTAKYICDIGTATENLGRAGLYLLLLQEIRGFLSGAWTDQDQFQGREEARGLPANLAALSAFEKIGILKGYSEKIGGNHREGSAFELAAAVTNRVFGEGENREFALDYALVLRYDEALCCILSGAAYNGCYARYLLAGGEIGPFSNQYLDYVRPLSGIVAADWKWRVKLQNSLPNPD